MREASDSDFVFFDDVSKTKNLSCFDSIFFVALVNISTTEEEERIRMLLFERTELLEERRITKGYLFGSALRFFIGRLTLFCFTCFSGHLLSYLCSSFGDLCLGSFFSLLIIERKCCKLNLIDSEIQLLSEKETVPNCTNRIAEIHFTAELTLHAFDKHLPALLTIGFPFGRRALLLELFLHCGNLNIFH